MNRLLKLSLALVCAGAALEASGPAAWEMSSYRDFLAGRFEGLSLSRDGRLALAPRAEPLFASGQPIIWTVVQARDGTLYAGTGHNGRVFRIDSSGKAAVLWTADQPEVFALALDPQGVLYAATSPDGRIYRIDNGKASEYYNPGAKYIWALAFAKDGTLYAGTGDQGKIYRIAPGGHGEVYYDTGQSHVTCLAIDQQGRLLAGSEPNGMLYRITAKDQAFVLYDAALPEIRTIVPGPDGAIYAAALGGSLQRRVLGGVSSTPGVPSSASVTTTATVTVEAAQGGADIRPKPEAAKPPAPQGAPVAAQAAATMEVPGVEKSAIYRIDQDNTVESLWSSKEENIYDLVLSGRRIEFATDGQGRIYELGPDRKASLVAQTNEGEAVRLVATAAGTIAATGDGGKLYRLGAQQATGGSYESPVHDSGTVARWGRLSWHGDLPAGARLAFRTRSGNSIRPDRTWSDWSPPLADAGGSPVTSPNARYIQWKAEFSSGARGGPELSSVTLAYQPQNTPPAVKSITVTTQLSSAAAAKQAAQAQAQAAATSTYSVTVTDTGEAAPQASTGTPTQNVGRPGAEQLQITWQAEDPDGDRMAYTLYFRGEDEREWKVLKAGLNENTYVLDADALADGKYLFRVVASDNPANPPDTAREAELVSSPTLIDHTPPVVTIAAPKRAGARLEVNFDAADAASPLRRCEYSVDAGPWVPVAPVDGILDSERESFRLAIENLGPGEHLLVVRALDSANNAGLGKAVVR